MGFDNCAKCDDKCTECVDGYSLSLLRKKCKLDWLETLWKWNGGSHPFMLTLFILYYYKFLSDVF